MRIQTCSRVGVTLTAGQHVISCCVCIALTNAFSRIASSVAKVANLARCGLQNSSHGENRIRSRCHRQATSLTLTRFGYSVSTTASIYRVRYAVVKTVTVKFDALGDAYLTVVTDYVASEATPKTGKAETGFDFGIKTMFTSSDGTKHESPEFYKRGSNQIARANRAHAKKQRGSNNRERARKDVARTHRKISRQRENHHWKLAKHLVLTHDVLVFETLTFEGMKRLWGRKVSDIAPYAFHLKLQHQAQKHDKQVVYIDRWEPTSKTCSTCGQLNALIELKTRHWQCQGCKQTHDRDVNAAINILRVGTSTLAESACQTHTA